MARFSPMRLAFGRPPSNDDDDNGDGLPTPFKAKASARRMAGITEAKEIVERLPGPGESLHTLHTARLDLCDVLGEMLDKVGQCDRMLLATLGMNRRNLIVMTNWLDTGRVKSLGLVVSKFYRAHKGALYDDTIEEFHKRGQRVACCDSHAKVSTLHLADGRAFTLEGSANLASNGSAREQVAIFSDPALADWHAAWIRELLDKHEGKEK